MQILDPFLEPYSSFGQAKTRAKPRRNLGKEANIDKTK